MTVALSIIFVYIFIALLTGGSKVLTLFKHMNPLGEQVSDLYLAKAGAMVKATVRGQFIIALCQGIAGALSIYIAGFHDGFFMFVILLTMLSFIPLGSGIVTIPVGIGMALFGNVIGGVFIVLFHILVVSSIDNVLRPFLVPNEAHLHPALMLLSVFAGLRMFGFWGIVLGPVIMIIIVTTISVYLEVYQGVAMEAPRARPNRQTKLVTPSRQEARTHPARRLRIRGHPAGASGCYPMSRSLRKLDDLFAGLIGRVPVHLTNLVGQHRMRHSAESARIAPARIDLDDLERVLQAVLQGLEPFGRHHRVLAEAKAERAEPVIGRTPLDDPKLTLRQAGVATPSRRQRHRQHGLAEHRRQHAVVDGSRQREAAGEALPDHTDAPATACAR